MVPLPSIDNRLWYTAVPSTACSQLLLLVVRAPFGGTSRRFGYSVSSRFVCLRWCSSAIELNVGVWHSLVSSGVIEVCVGFKVIVGLSLDEISISFRLISLTPLIEEADSNNLPIQSLEVVSVVLAKALGDFPASPVKLAVVFSSSPSIDDGVWLCDACIALLFRVDTRLPLSLKSTRVL